MFRLCLAPASRLAPDPKVGSGRCRCPRPEGRAFRHRPCGSPKGAAGIDRIVAPAPPEGGASAASQPPEGGSDAKWIHPKATHASARITRRRLVSDADRVASPKGCFAIRRTTPKGAPWFELLLSILPRLPAYHWRARSPPTPDTRRHRSSARHSSLASRRMLRRTRPCDPRRNRGGGRTGRPPEGGPLTVHDSGDVQQAGAPVSGQTDIVFMNARPV